MAKILAVVLAATLVLIGLSTVLVWKGLETETAIAESWEQRNLANTLAHQLRQTSDDLTRMARTYAVTGDERFRRHFDRILAIRNGVEPRPRDYHLAYWDLMTAGDAPQAVAALSTEVDDPVALSTLVADASFTEVELAMLAESEAESNALTKLENDAFAAVRQGDLQKAQALLHSDAYHQAKAKIMLPIRHFVQAMENRTAAEVQRLTREQGKLHRYALGTTTVLLAFVGTALVLSRAAARARKRPTAN